LTVVPCASAEEAILGADIVTTVTADKNCDHPHRQHAVGPGVHINAVGGDCPGKTELPPTPAPVRHLRRTPAPDPDRGRDPALPPTIR
jgi:hypothetical protein